MCLAKQQHSQRYWEKFYKIEHIELNKREN